MTAHSTNGIAEERLAHMSEDKTGSCLCGTVSYVIVGPLRPIVACHCQQCRKASGHYFAATQCLASDIRIIGETLKWFSSSASAERGFCCQCGSNLFWRRFGNANISICAGSLDGKTGLQIASQIHTDSKGDYYSLPDVPVIDQSSLA
jgi:hypothetical protein